MILRYVAHHVSYSSRLLVSRHTFHSSVSANQTLPNCCKLPPLQSNYSPKGKFIPLNDTDAYVTGKTGSKYGVIHIFDIFGYHPNQSADLIGDEGMLVIMPDFFRKKPWPADNFPPKEGFQALLDWVGKVGTLEAITPELTAAKKYLKEQGVEHLFVIGNCWGAKRGIEDSKTGDYKAVAMAHPSFVEPSDAEPLAVPLINICSKDEPDFTDFNKIIAKKPFADKCVYYRFEDQAHGFTAAGGDWSDPKVAEGAHKAIEAIASFFKENSTA